MLSSLPVPVPPGNPDGGYPAAAGTSMTRVEADPVAAPATAGPRPPARKVAFPCTRPPGVL